MPFVAPSPEELQAVQSLRASLEATEDIVLSPRITDVCILRFFRGSKGKEDIALRELIKHAKWRQETNADEIHNFLPRFQNQLDKRLSILHHVDKERRPCLYCFVHRHDASNRDLEEMILFIVYSLESMVRNGHPEQEMFTVFFDLSRFSMKNMDFEVVKHLISILQSNYPDTLEKFHIVDAPMLFSACWTVIRPWIDPVTSNKVKFIRRSQILEFCHEEDVPSFDD